MSAGVERARRLLAGSTTAELVLIFRMTDSLLERRAELAPVDDASICMTRGWLIDELDRRGELGLLDPAFA